MTKFKGELLMLITAIMWGSGFVGMAIGLEHFTVFQLMAGRFTLATVLLCIIFYKKLKLFNWSIIWKGALLGGILFFAFVLQTYGLSYTTPSKNAFLTSINVLVVPIIAFIVYKRGFDRYEVVAAVIAVVGIGFLSLTDSFTIQMGDFLSILCAIAFAFDIFYTNVFVKKEDALALTIVQFMTASLLSIIGVISLGEIPTSINTEGFLILLYLAVFCTLIAYVCQNIGMQYANPTKSAIIGVISLGEIPTSINTEGFLILLYLAVFCTLIAYVCQNIGMQYANPTKSAIILSMEALFGTLFSVWILHELLTGRMIVGCVLILIAVLFAEIKPKFKWVSIKA